MLFQSPIFLFAFLPIALSTYFVARRLGVEKAHLIIASLIFYGYWDLRLMPLLLSSILLNWIISNLALASERRRGFFVALGVAANLILLGIFKYADFFTGIFSDLGLISPYRWNIVLPLAISFFTFHEISFLLDIHRGNGKRYSLSDFMLYIVFFPHLISGPIVRHNEFIFQIEEVRTHLLLPEMIGRGATMFILGLAKKIWLADPLSRIVDPFFTNPGSTALGFFDAWTALLAFTLQIYFDFSGYTDMAIGLSLMFGFVLPQNFNAPYKASSIVELWRRWHMTLTRFLTDYLYSPISLYLARKAQVMRAGTWNAFIMTIAIPVVLTFLVSGFWHGAGWNFIMFGLVTGVAMTIDSAWRHAKMPHLPVFVAWPLTIVVFIVSLVFFRASNLGQAWDILSTLFMPESWNWRPSMKDYVLIAAGFAFATVGPTNQQLTFERAKGQLWFSIVLGVLLALTLVEILSSNSYAPFIYFQF